MTITSATIGSLHVSRYTRKARATPRVLEKEEFIVQIKMMLLYFNSTSQSHRGYITQGAFWRSSITHGGIWRGSITQGVFWRGSTFMDGSSWSHSVKQLSENSTKSSQCESWGDWYCLLLTLPLLNFFSWKLLERWSAWPVIIDHGWSFHNCSIRSLAQTEECFRETKQSKVFLDSEREAINTTCCYHWMLEVWLGNMHSDIRQCWPLDFTSAHVQLRYKKK